MNTAFVSLGIGSIVAGWRYLDGFNFHRIFLIILGISLTLNENTDCNQTQEIQIIICDTGIFLQHCFDIIFNYRLPFLSDEFHYYWVLYGSGGRAMAGLSEKEKAYRKINLPDQRWRIYVFRTWMRFDLHPVWKY